MNAKVEDWMLEAYKYPSEEFKKTYDAAKKALKSDIINHPPHYTSGGVECIVAMEAMLTKEEFIGYLKGSVFKYNWRTGRKGLPIEDVKKAQWYMNKLVEVLSKE